MNATTKPEADALSAPHDALQALRAPLKAHQINYLPKPMAKRDVMDGLPKAKCSVCGQYHATSKVAHLEYAGHAAVTDRLLEADPTWTWEPMTLSPDGLPMLDGYGGMWIRLTAGGVTRLGYGHAGDKVGGDAIKEIIGDALRNAAMRFGVALELWHKGDLWIDGDEPIPVQTGPRRASEAAAPAAAAQPDPDTGEIPAPAATPAPAALLRKPPAAAPAAAPTEEGPLASAGACLNVIKTAKLKNYDIADVLQACGLSHLDPTTLSGLTEAGFQAMKGAMK